MEERTDQNIESKINEPTDQIADNKNESHLEEHKVIDLYQGVRGLAVKILNRVERTDAYLDKLLDNELKNAELNGTDKALLYEIVHGVTRWQGRLDWILNGFYKGQFSKAIPNLKNGLRVALYQILFLDRIPDHAAVNEAVEFVKKLQGQKPADLTNAILRNIIRSKNSIRYPDPNEDILGYLSAYYSHPAWMVKRYLERFGREDTEKLLNTNNEKPYLTLRVNAIKTNPAEFKSLLQQVNLKYRPGKFLDEFVQLQNLTNITAWDYYVKGYFNIQDESAGLAVRLLDVAPGMKVLDMCAAPGGKTDYLGSLMNNEGSITALDRYEGRLKLVRKNNERLGLTCVTTIESDALEFEVNIPEEKMRNITVPVYSLQQLAENAIKHNSLTRESPLKIEIVYNGNTNEIKVSNNLQSKQNYETSLGTGLANLSERYKLMGYKGVDIRNDGKKFVVAIQLMNNESSYN